MAFVRQGWRPKTIKAGEALEKALCFGWIDGLSALLKGYEPAYTNFQAIPPSVKKTYKRAYLDAKTDVGREKKIAWMVDRLNKNLKPM